MSNRVSIVVRHVLGENCDELLDRVVTCHYLFQLQILRAELDFSACDLQEAMFSDRWESRPREFHPEALAEPDRTLSRHPAPIMEPHYVATASEQTTLDDDARCSRSSA